MISSITTRGIDDWISSRIGNGRYCSNYAAEHMLGSEVGQNPIERAWFIQRWKRSLKLPVV